MKKIGTYLTALFLCAALMAGSASAYIHRGTVQITSDTEEIRFCTGEIFQVRLQLDPAQDRQTPGCGMADCPEKCGQNCLSAEGNCTCDGTYLETYYADVQISNDDPGVVEVTYQDGTATFTALKPGTSNVTLAVRLREYTGSSVVIPVTVESSGLGPALWVGLAFAVVLAAAVLIAVVKKKG